MIHYWNMIFPMLQFLAIHAGYSICWIAIVGTFMNTPRKNMIGVLIGGIVAVIHSFDGYIETLLWTLVIGMACALIKLLMWVCITTRIVKHHPDIMKQIDEIKQSGTMSESALEKIYEENKDVINSNELIKTRLYEEVLNWRRLNNIKWRVVTDDGQRRFINVNHRCVNWLK